MSVLRSYLVPIGVKHRADANTPHMANSVSLSKADLRIISVLEGRFRYIDSHQEEYIVLFRFIPLPSSLEWKLSQVVRKLKQETVVGTKNELRGYSKSTT